MQTAEPEKADSYAAFCRHRSDFPEIDQVLRRFVRRARWSAVFEFLGLAIAIFLGLMIAGSVLDRWLALSRPVRFAVFCLDMLVSLAIIARPVILLFRRRFDPITVAMEIEQTHPEFDQKLITVVSDSDQPGVMLRQLRDQTQAMMSQVDIYPRRRLRRALWPWVTAISLTFSIVLFWGLSGNEMRSSLVRLFQPWK